MVLHRLKTNLKLLTRLFIVASVLSACNGGANNNLTKDNPPRPYKVNISMPGPDIVGALVAPSNIVAKVGESQVVGIVFQTSSLNATNLQVNLADLPSNWAVQDARSDEHICANVDNEAGCVLNLIYTPIASDKDKIFDLNYSYSNSKGELVKDKVSILYSVSKSNNILAITSPIGLINPAPNHVQSVTIPFISNNNSMIESFTVTNLESLPVSWQLNSEDKNFSCQSVTTGSGCVLSLIYMPQQLESGDFVLNYRYKSSDGAMKSGFTNIAYNVAESGKVIANYPNVVNGLVNTMQLVKVNFTTDDGISLSNLHIDLSKINATFPGWSTAGNQSFDCLNIGATNACTLNLIYKPNTSLSQSRLTIPYVYLNSNNELKRDSINILYKASNSIADKVDVTTDKLLPLVTNLNKEANLTIKFNSLATITNLHMLTNLAKLNQSWTATHTELNCPKLSQADDDCSIKLTYIPTTTSDAGAQVLRYEYVDSKGKKQTASYIIKYHPKNVTNVIANLNGNALSAQVGETTTVNVSFTTDNESEANNLRLYISGNPAVVIGESGNYCSKINSSPATCSLSLTYTPAKVESGQVLLNYNYIYNDGHAGMGKWLNITYVAKSNNMVKVVETTKHGVENLTNNHPFEAVVGDSESLVLSFTTYDSSLASKFYLNLTSLPDNWSKTGGDNSCNYVNDAYNCQTTLTYTPDKLESGSLQLAYSYINSDHIRKDETLTIPYLSLNHGWDKIASYTIDTGGKLNDLSKLTFSPMVVIESNGAKPMFMVNYNYMPSDPESHPRFSALDTLIESAGKLQLYGYSPFLAPAKQVSVSAPYLAQDNNGIIYRSYNLTNFANVLSGYKQDSSNIVVQRLDESNAKWVSIGESRGVFSLAHAKSELQIQQTYPVISFDQHNQIYLTAGGAKNQLTPLSVLMYKNNIWQSVGEFSAPDSLYSFVDSLTIDAKGNIYAGYNDMPGSSSTLSLFKYTQAQSSWVKLPTALESYTNSTSLLDSKGNLFTDSNNDLYLFARGQLSRQNMLFKYANSQWLKVGNQDVFNCSSSSVAQFIINKQDNTIYAVVGGKSLNVYKYNPTTNVWDIVGSHDFAYTNSTNYAARAINIALAKDNTLYVATHVGYEDHIDLYKYKID